jgi:SAM-dependent methyltransferase
MQIKEREEGRVRLHPPFLSARWYYLNQLGSQLQTVISLFVSKDSGLKLADYGCGNMPYKPLFDTSVSEYTGIDLRENPKAQVHIAPDGQIESADAQQDIVLSTQVLEHVENPRRYLSEAHRILKPDGLLILSTHGYWIYHPDPTDYWRWTSSGLKKIIQEAGFEIIYFKGVLGRAAMGLQLFQDGLLFKLPPFLRPLLAALIQPWIYFFDQFSSQQAKDADACTYVVVAKARKT